MEYALRFEFAASNNEAEYEALIAGLNLAQKVGAKHVVICSDSQLVVNQVTSEYEARELTMIAYLAKVKEALLNF